ncbi:unnamed protein product [Protopolystoma xenopodis]|uniref:Uncharacterized protein n=1 Tax=Protopolystoma xenopodis TaxID=117903 RepID=A0A3S5A8H9_9PLAT|nr:unnamed protein product [Protopolystoma xenopodis]
MSIYPGSQCYFALIEKFGADAILTTGQSDSDLPPIDRHKLGAIVLSDSRKLECLNSILWPHMTLMIKSEINRLYLNEKGKADPGDGVIEASMPKLIFVLDAAVLFDAKWDKFCNEIWLTVLPRDECQRRLGERTNVTLALADSLLSRQADSVAKATASSVTPLNLNDKAKQEDDPVDWWTPSQIGGVSGPYPRANVIISTQWEPEFTQKQVELAYRGLISRLNSCNH